jgi:hypothetical protein
MPIKSAVVKTPWKPSGGTKDKGPPLLSSLGFGGLVGKKLATPPPKTTNSSQSPRHAAVLPPPTPLTIHAAPIIQLPPPTPPPPPPPPQILISPPTPRTPTPPVEPAAELKSEATLFVPVPMPIHEPELPTPSTTSEQPEYERAPTPERPPSPLRDGLVSIKYADLMARLSIESGHLSVDLIDDELALRAVYPRCDIELSRIPPIGIDMKTAQWDSLEARDAYGVFFGLEAGVTYWVIIREHPEEIERDELRREVLRAESEAELNRRRLAAESTESSEPLL